MVTGKVIDWRSGQYFGTKKAKVSLEGKSTDSKPAIVNADGDGDITVGTNPDVTVANGSSFFEMNTGKLYLYDEAGSSWLEV